MRLAVQNHRFMLSPDGQTGDWIDPAEVPHRCLDWTDCTDMDDEQFQRVIAERLANRPHIVSLAVAAAPSARKPQPRMVERKCKWCKKPFQARAADVKRGWAKFCSKSCKAMDQEKRTGQYRATQGGERLSEVEQRERDHQQALYESSSCHGQDPGEGFF